MKTIIIALAASALALSAASAAPKPLKTGSTTANVPTGIDVKGPTDHRGPRGNFRPDYRDKRGVARLREDWQFNPERKSGAGPDPSPK